MRDLQKKIFSLNIFLGHFQHPPWTLCPLHGHFHTLMVTFFALMAAFSLKDGDIFSSTVTFTS